MASQPLTQHHKNKMDVCAQEVTHTSTMALRFQELKIPGA